MKTNQKIIEYIKKNKQATGSELADFLELSDRAIRKQLSSMFEKRILDKIGKPPKVFYFLKKYSNLELDNQKIESRMKDKINDNYIIITPAGERIEGLKGFAYWCNKNGLPIDKTAKEYIKTINRYEAFKKSGFIDGMDKMKNTFKKVYLDNIFYLDFYSIERFGKTKLGQLLLYAKQSQNKKLMKELITNIKPKADEMIEKYKIDGICYVPPTVKRETQLMKVLEKGLKENIRNIKISKIKTSIIVPQKTLNKLNDRIENAKNTFAVEEKTVFKNILVIDDAIGSGATMNEIAKKIKDKNICSGKIIGLAITGSFKGFDVISEV